MSHATVAVPPPSPASDPPKVESPVLGYTFGPYHLNVTTRELTKDGEAVPLTAKVFETLLVLVRNHTRPVTKEELIQAVWPGSFVSDDSLVQNISALRRALGDDSSQPRYIATLARRGYRFVATTVEHTEAGPVPAARDAAPAIDAGHRVERPIRKPPTALIAAFALGAVVAAGSAIVWTRARPAPGPVAAARFQEQLPPNQSLRGSVVVSPDGQTLAFSAQDPDGVTRIWVRPIDAPEAHAIPGTEGATSPFWSPDSEFLGFAAGGEVKRVGLSTGSIRAIVPTHRVTPLGTSWGVNDTVLYADLGKIFSVPAAGGASKVVAAAESGDLGELRWPQMLPDGRHFLFFASGVTPERGGTFLASLGSSDVTQLVPGYRATFAPPDHLLYVRDRTLIAQRVDIPGARLDGSPMTIPGDVPGSALISASRDGKVLVVTAGNNRQRLVWFDRQGKSLSTVNSPTPLADLALSPNGRLALAATLEAGSYELWLVDLERNVSTKVATDGTFPAWSPDGARFAYTLVGPDGADLYVQSTSGTPQPMPWLRTKELKSVNSWSPDGRFIVFSKYTTRDQTSQDLWLLPATGENAKPVPYLQTKAREREGRLSPDGRWMAYTSDETGTNEIYVQSFPTPGLKVRVSNGGGTQPLWRQDGRELFYVSADHRVVSVAVSGGSDFRPSTPQPLFALPSVSTALRQVEVSGDGQRFLAVDWDVARQENHVTVLTNWEAAQRP